MSEDADKPSQGLPSGDGILRREFFSEQGLKAYAEMAAKGGMRVTTEEEREASRKVVLSALAPGEDAWVFGYGSLMWNPLMEVAESRIARIRGFSRHFCLTLNMGRGTPEQPGLMLGLDEGGACVGVAHRVTVSRFDSDLKLLWQRELMLGAYTPHWIAAETEQGPIRTVAFVIRRDSPRYEGKLDDEAVARRIACASGVLGTNRDYLYRTTAHLAELGIVDEPLAALAARVRELANETASDGVG